MCRASRGSNSRSGSAEGSFEKASREPLTSSHFDPNKREMTKPDPEKMLGRHHGDFGVINMDERKG